MYENQFYDNPQQRTQPTVNAAYTQIPDPAPAPATAAPEAPKKSGAGKAFGRVFGAICLGLLFGLCAGLGFYTVTKYTGAITIGQTAAPTEVSTAAQTTSLLADDQTQTAGGSLAAGSEVSAEVKQLVTSESEVIKSVVSKVMPSMVSITERYMATTGYSIWGQAYEQEAEASGTGILIGETDTEYLIVTNNHVIEAGETLEVTFVDGSTAEANIKGTDVSRDLAIIAVQKSVVEASTQSQISLATLGDSDKLELGEYVIAIGNALGYGQSVTNGIISALNREVTTEDGYTNTFIQTNAAINPGNSGGALLNMEGQVIGINSNKIGGSAVEGMGYAIPISSVKDIIAELMEKETMIRVAEDQVGYIGINLQEITATMAQHFNMPQGIYVVDVLDDGGAKAAGMQPGDIITEFDGNTIDSYATLENLMKYYAEGTEVEITFERQEGGTYQEHTVTLTLGHRPEGF